MLLATLTVFTVAFAFALAGGVSWYRRRRIIQISKRLFAVL